jgi:hypothetical protein
MFWKNHYLGPKLMWNALDKLWKTLFVENYLVITSWDDLLFFKPFQMPFPQPFYIKMHFPHGKIFSVLPKE